MRVSILFVLLVSWVFLVFLIDPRGEFPLNDDWLYARVAEGFLQERVIEKPPLAAVSLVFQTLWGSGFASIFGLSHTILRLSNLVLHLFSVLVTSLIVLEIGAAGAMALLAGLTILISPVVLVSAFSYMPEPALLATTTFALYAAIRWEKRRRLIAGIGFFLYASMAYLVHPIALLIPVWFLFSWTRREGRIGSISWPTWLTIAGSVPFLLWYFDTGSESSMTEFWLSQSLSMGAPLRLFTRLPGTMLTLGLFLLPVGFAVLRWRRVHMPLLLFVWSWGQASWCGDAAILPLPSLENVLHGAGLGFVGLQGTPPVLSPAIWWMITVLASFSMLGITQSFFTYGRGTTITAIGLAALPWIGSLVLGPSLLRAGFIGIAGLLCWVALMWIPLRGTSTGVLFFLWAGVILLAPPFYDRYLVAVIPLLLIGVLHRAAPPKPWVWLIVIFVFVGSTVAVSDYLTWNKVRWALADVLTDEHEIPVDQIDGGYEWAGWHYAWRGVPDHDASDTSSGLPWWIRLWAPQIKPRYVISLSPLPGYAVHSSHPCPTMIPGWTIYLLKRIPPSFDNIAESSPCDVEQLKVEG